MHLRAACCRIGRKASGDDVDAAIRRWKRPGFKAAAPRGSATFAILHAEKNQPLAQTSQRQADPGQLCAPQPKEREPKPCPALCASIAEVAASEGACVLPATDCQREVCAKSKRNEKIRAMCAEQSATAQSEAPRTLRHALAQGSATPLPHCVISERRERVCWLADAKQPSWPEFAHRG